MNRLFCRSSWVEGGEIRVTDPDQLRHLKVLRVTPGEPVVAFDEHGVEYDCRVTEVSRGQVVLAVERRQTPQPKSGPSITVAVAIPKKSKIDDIVEKLTQLGVDRVIPLLTERVVVRPSGRDLAVRHARWQKIAFNASQQSQRNSIPLVDLPIRFAELIAQSRGFDLKLIPTLEGDRVSLKEAFKDISPANVLALIGPEGDFSPAETAAARAAGFLPVSFGANVLRVETAALYVCSILSYVFRG